MHDMKRSESIKWKRNERMGTMLPSLVGCPIGTPPQSGNRTTAGRLDEMAKAVARAKQPPTEPLDKLKLDFGNQELLSFKTKLVGMRHHGPLPNNGQIMLWRDPNNKYDANAIAVYEKNRLEKSVGHIGASVAEWLAPLLDSGVVARVALSDDSGGIVVTLYGSDDIEYAVLLEQYVRQGIKVQKPGYAGPTILDGDTWLVKRRDALRSGTSSTSTN